MLKNKSHPKLSPENYIRTKARLLPLGECYINEGWKESGMAFITVTRRHVTGNLTIGCFQVDLYCLGVKDAFWYFNESPEIINEFKAKQLEFSDGDDKLILANYEKIHNIIYGAVAYAEDLGFRPHKEFSLAQFVLEEDDDRIELIDIEFGLNGKPAVFMGVEKHPELIFNILDKSVGKGNYSVFNNDDELNNQSAFKEEEDYDDLDDDPDLEDDRYIDKPLEEYNEQDFEDIIKGDRIMKPEDFFLFSYALALQNTEKKEKRELRSIEKMISKWKITKDDHSEIQQFSTSAEKELYNKLYIEMQENALESIPSIKKALKVFPESYNLNNLLGMAYDRADRIDLLDQVAEDLFRRFPDEVVATNNYLNRLILTDKLAEAEKLILPGSDLHKQFPKRKKFTPLEFFTFVVLQINYHLAKNEILKAAAFASGLTLFEWISEQKSKADFFYLKVSNELKNHIQPGNLEDIT